MPITSVSSTPFSPIESAIQNPAVSVIDSAEANPSAAGRQADHANLYKSGGKVAAQKLLGVVSTGFEKKMIDNNMPGFDINNLKKIKVQKTDSTSGLIWSETRYVLKQTLQTPAPFTADNLDAINDLEFRVVIDDVSDKLQKEFFAATGGLKKGNNPDYQPVDIKPSSDIAAQPAKGVHEDVGGRGSMEDMTILDACEFTINGQSHTIDIAGVADGHGGNQCSAYVKEHLARTLKKWLEFFNPQQLTTTGIWNALKIASVDLSRSFGTIGHLEKPLFFWHDNVFSSVTSLS